MIAGEQKRARRHILAEGGQRHFIAGEQKRARRHILGGGGQRHFLKLYSGFEQKSRHILNIPLFFQLV